MTLEFSGPALPLTTGGVSALAAKWGVDPAWIWAVVDTESAGGGFLPDTRPKILYEAHIFGRETGHQWDGSHPNISAPGWDRSLYGAAGAHQYDRLAEAIALDRAAALQSASWGMFQVLGLNWQACGAGSVEDFVARMCISEDNHLAAFAAFCEHGGLDRKLRAGDIGGFVEGYNGPGQVDYYAGVMQANYWHHAQPDRRAAIMSWQQNWNHEHPDEPPLLVDGIAGPKTLAAGYVDG